MQHNGIFKRKHQRSGGKQVCTYQFTVPEIKIAFVLLYWLVLAIMLWTSVSRRTGHSDAHNSHIRSYADCMAGGDRKDHDCHMLRRSWGWIKSCGRSNLPNVDCIFEFCKPPFCDTIPDCAQLEKLHGRVALNEPHIIIICDVIAGLKVILARSRKVLTTINATILLYIQPTPYVIAVK